VIGIILGALAGLTYVSLGVDALWISLSAVYLALVPVIVLGFVFGRVAPTTVGTSARMGMVGALIGAVASLSENPSATLLLVLHAGACLLVQQFTKSRLLADQQGVSKVVRTWPFIVIAILLPFAVVGLIQLATGAIGALSLLAWLGIAGAIKVVVDDRRALDLNPLREDA